MRCDRFTPPQTETKPCGPDKVKGSDLLRASHAGRPVHRARQIPTGSGTRARSGLPQWSHTTLLITLRGRPGQLTAFWQLVRCDGRPLPGRRIHITAAMRTRRVSMSEHSSRRNFRTGSPSSKTSRSPHFGYRVAGSPHPLLIFSPINSRILHASLGALDKHQPTLSRKRGGGAFAGAHPSHSH